MIKRETNREKIRKTKTQMFYAKDFANDNRIRSGLTVCIIHSVKPLSTSAKFRIYQSIYIFCEKNEFNSETYFPSKKGAGGSRPPLTPHWICYCVYHGILCAVMTNSFPFPLRQSGNVTSTQPTVFFFNVIIRRH